MYALPENPDVRFTPESMAHVIEMSAKGQKRTLPEPHCFKFQTNSAVRGRITLTFQDGHVRSLEPDIAFEDGRFFAGTGLHGDLIPGGRQRSSGT